MDFEGFAGIAHIVPGHGFTRLLGTLPTQAVAAFRGLAHADMIMSQPDLVPSENDLKKVLHIRNSAIHSVLSLDSWEELPVADKDATDPVLYDACGAVSIIYSNAVLLGLPTHNGWHRDFVRKLRNILESADIEALAQQSAPLLMWILYIGSIASFRTPH